MNLFSFWRKTFSQRLIYNSLFLLITPCVLKEPLQVKLHCSTLPEPLQVQKKENHH